MRRPYSKVLESLNSVKYKPRYIIQFGNVRTPPQIAAAISTMETNYFNGTVLRAQYTDPSLGFTNLDQQVSRNYAVPYSLLEASVAISNATNFQRFKHNFMRLDVARPGTADLFNDTHLAAFINNIRMGARAAKNARCKGLLLDMEAYDSSIFWRFTSLTPGPTFAQYQARYLYAGQLAIAAIEQEFPLCKVAIFISYEQLKDATSLALLTADRYSLLPKFIDGLHDGATTTKLICGNEEAYVNQTDADFDYDLELQTPPNVPWLGSDNYSAVHVDGFSTWVEAPDSSLNFTYPTLNYNTPAIFRGNLQKMIARMQANSYCFVYTQVARWPGWGNTDGVDTMPAEYIRALNTLQDPSVGRF